MPAFINYFYGAKLGWTVQDHISEGYAAYPGEDIVIGPGVPIRLPATGYLTRPERRPGESKYAKITRTDGTTTLIREIGSFAGAFNQTLQQGTVIGYTSAKWPHFEIWHNGQALSFIQVCRQYEEIERPKPQPTPEPELDEQLIFEIGNEMKYIYKTEGGNAWAILDSHLQNGYLSTTTSSVANDYSRVSPTAGQLVSAAEFTASIAAAQWYKNQTTTATNPLTTDQNAALMGLPASIDNMPTNSEMGGILTAQYNQIKADATANKNEILTAIDEIPASEAANLVVTSTIAPAPAQ